MKECSFGKVLVIDDNSVDVFIISELTKMVKFSSQLLTFASPTKAINYITTINYQEDIPDVIFLDIHMPLINGWEVLERIKEYINPYQTKIFIVTSSLRREERLKAEKDSYISEVLIKPNTVEEIEALKEKYQLNPT